MVKPKFNLSSIHDIKQSQKKPFQRQDKKKVSTNNVTEPKLYKIQTFVYGNDPSAGSPTETLLRLLLPLNDQVRPTLRRLGSIS